jgi:hypothetical protein
VATLTGTAVLPGGYWDTQGRLHREVELRPLTGHEEELLTGPDPGNVATAVTTVLVRCLVRLADLEPVPADVVRRLLAADRDYLLLQLRGLTFGDVIRADLACPWAECGEQVTLEFRLTDLPVREPAERAPLYELVLAEPAAEAGAHVWFRLPNGSDQEELSPWAAGNEAAALTALLQRCIHRLDASGPPSAEQVRSLSSAARTQLEAELQRLAPQVESIVDSRCAECGRSFAVPLDLRRFFFGELRADRDVLYREVHQLAYHYHWSEPEILALPRAKRRTYLELLGDEIERLNDGL